MYVTGLRGGAETSCVSKAPQDMSPWIPQGSENKWFLSHWTVRDKPGLSLECHLQFLKPEMTFMPTYLFYRGQFWPKAGDMPHAWSRREIQAVCWRERQRSPSVIFPPASAWPSHLCLSVSSLSHTCWQSAPTCVVPVCTKAWLQKSGVFIFAYLVCSQMGVVFISQFPSAKGKNYSGAINVCILNSRPHVLCI